MGMKLIPKLNTLKLIPRVHIFNQTIYFNTLSSLCGDSKESIVINLIGDFSGTCIRSKDFKNFI